jgi:23S rRNA (uracil1939-C5)-methyltransferase
MVWLVEGALPGDLVEVEPVRRHLRFVEARSLRVVRASPLRRPAPCPIQAECGGCAWMILEDEAQGSWKRRLVADALARIGGIAEARVDPIASAPPPLGYRNRVELTLLPGPVAGTFHFGFHPPGDGSRVVEVERCALVDEAQNRAIAEVRAFFRDRPGALSIPLRVIVRKSTRTGKLLVALRGGAGPFPAAPDLAARLAERVPDVGSVVRIVSPPGRRGGARTLPILGPPWIDEEIAGLRFRLPAGTFCQVNPGASDSLAAVVDDLAAVTRGGTVLDLYGGVGVFGLLLARRGARVTVVDADPEAVGCGRRAAKEARIPVRYERSDVGRFVERLDRSPGRAPDVVVADPPRSGLPRSVAEAIGALGASRIVLVSCDPATLARDVRALSARGYRLDRAVPVDMFPQTPHVEAVALLVRERG